MNRTLTDPNPQPEPMRRRSWRWIAVTAGITLAFLIPSPSRELTVEGDEPKTQVVESEIEAPKETEEITAKTPFEKPAAAILRKKLGEESFNVTQKEATERPFKNAYWDNKKTGTYHCKVCDLPVFGSKAKYKSGTGWPSFYAPLKSENVGTRSDWKLIYTRTEIHCERCKAHLGHVFDDGPQPTGKRYCLNSASLKFVEKK